MPNKSVLKKIKDKVVENAPVLERVKIVKELFIEKLDSILSTLSKISSEQDKILKGQDEARDLTDNILENHPFFFQSMSDTIHGVRVLLDSVQVGRNETQEQYKQIEQIHNKGIGEMLHSLQTIRNETKQQFKEIEQINKSLEKQSEIQQRYENLEQTIIKSIKEKVQTLNADIVVSQSYFQGVEVGLMTHLYSFLPNNLAIDIGANVGDISSYLLETGYEVYAFEPFPPIFSKLMGRFEKDPHFHGFPFAIGSTEETRDLYIVTDQTSPKIYQDSTLYNSLVQHSLCDGLVYTDSVSVKVRSLDSLHKSSEIPTNISLVKIDTEGFDLEVLNGMGDYRYPVVMAEFWDAACPFGESGARNRLPEMVRTMKSKSYAWHIVMYRIWGSTEASYYCNHPYSINNSWGNVFFFQDHGLFVEALKWCAATMPATYLTA